MKGSFYQHFQRAMGIDEEAVDLVKEQQQLTSSQISHTGNMLYGVWNGVKHYTGYVEESK